MKPCKFTFDDETVYDGFAHGSTWNGFDNVAVTKETLGKIIADLEYNNATPDDLENFTEIEPMENGLYSLGWGFATSIVDDYADILKTLAECDGACLYWQMPDVERAEAAAKAGFVQEADDLLVHPDAVQIEYGMAYTMPK